MLPPIGPNNELASITSQVRDASPQDQAPGSPIAATAESSRPTPPADPSAASSNSGDQAQISTSVRSMARPDTTTLLSSADAQQAASSLSESFSSNPSQSLLAQNGIERDPAAALLSTPPMVGVSMAY